MLIRDLTSRKVNLYPVVRRNSARFGIHGAHGTLGLRLLVTFPTTMMGAAHHRSSQPRLGAGKVVFGAFAVISAICYIASNTGAPELARAPAIHSTMRSARVARVGGPFMRDPGCVFRVSRPTRGLVARAMTDDGRIQFSDAQVSRFLQARKEVKSGAGDAYWDEIARRVGDGVTGYECKRLAQNQLFKKAAGTSQNFFKSYVDVKGEYVESGYVDADAPDAMSQMGNFFGGLFGAKKEVAKSEDGFFVGQRVQYKSATFNKWMDAKVQRLNKDGTIDLDVRDRANPSLIRPT
ncbi:hypothetical protein AAMO2058_000021600 [Amorphochlora amoebiformis]